MLPCLCAIKTVLPIPLFLPSPLFEHLPLFLSFSMALYLSFFQALFLSLPDNNLSGSSCFIVFPCFDFWCYSSSQFPLLSSITALLLSVASLNRLFAQYSMYCTRRKDFRLNTNLQKKWYSSKNSGCLMEGFTQLFFLLWFPFSLPVIFNYKLV